MEERRRGAATGGKSASLLCLLGIHRSHYHRRPPIGTHHCKKCFSMHSVVIYVSAAAVVRSCPDHQDLPQRLRVHGRLLLLLS